MKTKEIRALSTADRAAKMKETRESLMNARGVAAMGGAPRSPGEIRQLRTTIARILTIDNEEAKRAQ
ncbi:MAG TPA: 50S ribosomal protein L29 [Candidatus Thermoplasmatota archaeon]|nr:50S ribosomal protein L29 [Candidatus Thermoplasmatota archaeon]